MASCGTSVAVTTLPRPSAFGWRTSSIRLGGGGIIAAGDAAGSGVVATAAPMPAANCVPNFTGPPGPRSENGFACCCCSSGMSGTLSSQRAVGQSTALACVKGKCQRKGRGKALDRPLTSPRLALAATVISSGSVVTPRAQLELRLQLCKGTLHGGTGGGGKEASRVWRGCARPIAAATSGPVRTLGFSRPLGIDLVINNTKVSSTLD